MGVLSAHWPPVSKTLLPLAEPSFTTRLPLIDPWCLKPFCVRLTEYVMLMNFCSHYMAQAVLELAIVLPQLPECGDHRHALHCPPAMTISNALVLFTYFFQG